MTIGDAFELATNALFRELSNFATPPRAGRVTALEGSGQVRVETDDPDGGDVLAWPLDSFAYAVDDVVYVAFGVNSPDSAIVLGAKMAAATTYIRRSGVDTLTANWDIGEDRRILAEALRARDAEGLALEDDAGTVGLLLEDGGNVVIPNLSGSNAANGDISIQGTVNATRTSSYVILQPNGGNVVIGGSTPSQKLTVVGNLSIGTGVNSNMVANGDDSVLSFVGATAATEGAYVSLAGVDHATDAVRGRVEIVVNTKDSSAGGTLAILSYNGVSTWLTRLYLSRGGFFGFGPVTNPQGIIHAYDGTGSAALITKTGVAGTAVVMIPNATGDVTRCVQIHGVMRDSTPTRYDLSFKIDNGGSQNVDDGLGNRIVFTVAANGELSAQRALGALTYDFTVWCVWQ